MTAVRPIQHFGDELWIADGDRVRMLGIPFTTRMTIARLSDGGLWLHSPVRAEEDLLVAIENLVRRPPAVFTVWDAAEPCWSADLDQLLFAGSTVLTETVFLHRRSKTLIITDIIQNHEPEIDGWFWRTVKRINGISAPDGGVPRDWRMTVRDRDLARTARDRLLAWDFEHLVITHGRCVKFGAHEHVERAFAWLD